VAQATREPATIAAAVERGLPLPVGAGDRDSGYWVPGVAFESGDVLALRRFPATSPGPGYTSVWHRAPDGTWTFYSDAAPSHGCTESFAPGIRETIVAPIRSNGGARTAWRFLCERRAYRGVQPRGSDIGYSGISLASETGHRRAEPS
jgi:hypothetical protein